MLRSTGNVPGSGTGTGLYRWRLGDDFSYGQVALRGLGSGFWLGK